MPGIYLWCCALILAGNTAAPLGLRALVAAMRARAAPLRLDAAALRFALDRPRLVSTHLFDRFQARGSPQRAFSTDSGPVTRRNAPFRPIPGP